MRKGGKACSVGKRHVPGEFTGVYPLGEGYTGLGAQESTPEEGRLKCKSAKAIVWMRTTKKRVM